MHGLLVLTVLLAGIQLTNGENVVFKSSQTQIWPLQDKNLTIWCDVQTSQGQNDTNRKSLASGSSMTISRDGETLATVTDNSAAKRTGSDGGYNVTGELTPGVIGHLEITWPRPSRHDLGHFRCDVISVNQEGQRSTFSKQLTLSQVWVTLENGRNRIRRDMEKNDGNVEKEYLISEIMKKDSPMQPCHISIEQSIGDKEQQNITIAVEEERSAMKRESDANQKIIAAMEQEIEGLQDKYDAMKLKNYAMEQKNDAMNREYDAINKKNDAIKQKYDALEILNDQLVRKCDSMAEKNIQLNQKHGLVNQLYDAMDEGDVLIKREINSSDQEESAREQEISAMKNYSNAIRKLNDALEQENDALEDKYNAMRQKNNALEQRIDAMERQYDAMKLNNNALMQENVALKLKVFAIKHNYAELEQKYISIKQNIDTKEGKENKIGNKNVAVKRQFDVKDQKSNEMKQKTNVTEQINVTIEKSNSQTKNIGIDIRERGKQISLRRKNIAKREYKQNNGSKN